MKQLQARLTQKSYLEALEMDQKVIDSFFKIGRVLALTPSSIYNRHPNFFQRNYGYFILSVEVICVGFTWYNLAPFFKKFDTVQQTLLVLTSIATYAHNGYVFLVLMAFDRYLWFKLIDNLRRVNYKNDEKRSGYYLPIFLLTWFLVVTTFLFYTSFKKFRIEYMIPTTTSCVEMYMQLFYMVFYSTILNILLSEYSQQSLFLQQTFTRKKMDIRKIKQNLKRATNTFCTLKETTNIINEIFGWTTLTNTMGGAVRSVFYLEVVMKDYKSFKNLISVRFIYDFSVLLIFWIIFLSAVHCCDEILCKSEEILNTAYKAKITLCDSFICENQIIDDFIDVILCNKPEFTAARFFQIDRSIVFGVFNAIISFLLVLLQLKANVTKQTRGEV